MSCAHHPRRGKGVGLLLLITSGTAVLPWATSAQAVDTEEAIGMVAAAAEYAYAHLRETSLGLPDRVAAVDARRHVGTRPIRSEDDDLHDLAFLEGLTRSLDARVSHSQEAVTCPEGPRSCRMDGATVIFVVGAPEVHGDEASVSVEIVYRITVGERPILRAGWDVLLKRHDEGWQVTGLVGRWTS